VDADAFRYPFIRPVVPAPELWLPFLEPAYAERRFANGGPAATRLEQELTAAYGRGREAVVVSSGTAGLVAALLALDVTGRVVLPSFTFAATAYAVALAGCEPVFCEVSRDTWELDPAALALALEGDVAAVLHVRPFGLCRNPRRLRLQHLRGSTALAHEADVVLTMNEKWSSVSKTHLAYDAARARTYRQWIVLSIEKNRDGPAMVDLEFKKDFANYRFEPQGRFVAEQLVDDVLFEQ